MIDPHPREWVLRRLHVGELAGEQAREAQEHLQGCAECSQRMSGLESEQRRFEQAVSFERFEAGVQAAARGSRQQKKAQWAYPGLALAASIGVMLAVQPALNGPGTRLKGGSEIVLRVAGPRDGPQREVPTDVPEVLAPGERVRIGYQAAGDKYLAALSVDEQGTVTPLYPEAGASLRAESSHAMKYLPGSLEFTGKGRERVVVLLTDKPIKVDDLEREAKRAFHDAQEDVSRMGYLRVPGEQFHRTLIKP